jgi:predicted methyltransferase
MELKQSDYVLGHTDSERLRLIRQARVLAPATEHFLRDAGIGSGMRVLDIGCGMGDVTMLVAQLVGAQGRIISIDLDVRPPSRLPGSVRRLLGSITRRSIERISRPLRTLSRLMQSSGAWCSSSFRIRLRPSGVCVDCSGLAG